MARRQVLVVTALAVALATTGGCALPWQEDATEPSGTATSTPAPSPTPEPSRTPDLATTGSLDRELTAGASTLAVRYWTDAAPEDWTAAASKPISLSVTASSPDEAEVFLGALRAVTTVRDAQGDDLAAPQDVVDAATVQPGYAMTDPYSYSTTVVVPAVDPAAATVEVRLAYETLVETAPGSGEYAKQTAVDTIEVALAGAGTAAPETPAG